MDESWRMRMGMPTLPRRRSMETASIGSIKGSLFFGASATDDFSDVFGGPPRSVLSRRFSGDFTGSASFYEEVFRQPEFVSPAAKGGKSLPAFRIPAKGREGFYSDIFGSDDDLRKSRDRSRANSKAKSKSNSSSVLSSEELSPLCPVVGDDVALSSFASKLRPINVPCRWNSATMMPESGGQQRQGMPVFPCNNRQFYNDAQYMENVQYEDYFRSSSYYGFSRRFSSPETISIDPNSFGSVRRSADDDLELNSPSSPASSLCQEPDHQAGLQSSTLMHEYDILDQDDDEVMSSYVIEINSDHREGNNEAVSIDEAIAWAKEKYHTRSAETEHETNQSAVEATEEMSNTNKQHDSLDQQKAGSYETLSESPKEGSEQKKWKTEKEDDRSEEQLEMDLMDEDVKLWSFGKETNIRLLLSTLHHILWPNSGWQAISLTSLVETSQVKKAYQKARLCLHPDKLQQRSATLSQKYVADKAFSILQDAWAAFVTQDALSS